MALSVLTPGTENLNDRSQGSWSNHEAGVTGALRWQVDANRFRGSGFVVSVFDRVSSPWVSPKQSVDSHVGLIGQVASGNLLRGSVSRKQRKTDQVTGSRLLFSLSSIRPDSGRQLSPCPKRPIDRSFVNDRRPADKPLTFSSDHGRANQSHAGLMLAPAMPNYQDNNSPRSVVPWWQLDRSMRKITQDEKRNVDQRVAVGRMPDCDR
jgi:hypothetical protein